MTLLSYFFITLRNCEWENVSLSVCEILRVFVNTFTADDKYFLQNSQNLPQPIQMQLSKTQKNVFSMFCSISEIYIPF